MRVAKNIDVINVEKKGGKNVNYTISLNDNMRNNRLYRVYTDKRQESDRLTHR